MSPRRRPAATVRALLAAAALGLCACAGPAGPIDHDTWQDPAPHIFDIGPYILLGAPGQAFVSLRADVSTPPVVEWWETGDAAKATLPGEGRRTRVPASRHEDLWVATLEDLPIGPYIAYRVVSDVGTTSPHVFRVGADSNTFRFASFGDTRTGHVVHRAVVERVAAEDVDFLLHTGDMVTRGGIRGQWTRFFRIERPLLDDTPIVPAIGNHDQGARNYYRHYFLHERWAGDRRYYTHDWGHLRLVAIDGGIECRDGCAQYEFARQALREGARNGMLMVMFLHWPPYSSGEHGSQTYVQKPITDLARRYGVELVLSGHDHNYERTHPIHGTTYVVSGSAGAPIRTVDPRPFSAVTRTEPHYVLVDVERDGLHLRAINLDGRVFDEATIPDNAPQPE